MSESKMQVNNPDNMLLENCMDIFHLVQPLVSQDRGASLPSEFRDQLVRTFHEFEKSCLALQLEPSLISDVKYALAAFVDERVMASAWPNKLSWMGKPLQLEFFGDNLAGEMFFQKLNKLRQGGERYVDALEVYFLCLQLGFEGVYRLRGLEQLQALQVDLRTQIADARNKISRALSPHGTAADGILEKVQRSLPYWAIFAITVLIIFLGYLLFVILLSSKADEARKALVDDGQRITTNLERDATKRDTVAPPPVIREKPVAPPNPAPAPKAQKAKKRQPSRQVKKTVKQPVPDANADKRPPKSDNTWLKENGF